ncbi:MAG TPA: MFS transporter [Polyangiaceae bacterium]|nr:MFS transporter [Polyangiaceae bacterium]
MDSLPVTALHALLVVVCGLGLAFDTFEIVLGTALSAVFSAPPHALPAAQLALLLAAVYLGAIVGAPVLGYVADKQGRRRTLMSVLLWIALMSLAASRSQSAGQLTWLRALAGVGLGAYPPIMMTYLTDQLPPQRRGLLVFAASSVAMLGPPAVIFLVRGLISTHPLGLESWRWAFIVGGIGAAFVGIAFALLPESPRWLERTGQTSAAELSCRRFEESRTVWGQQHGVPSSTKGPALARAGVQRSVATRWSALAALFLLSPWSTTAFPLLSGAVLTQKGFRLPDTLLFIGLATLGSVLGSAVAAPAVDWFERRAALASFGLIMMLSVAVFMVSATPVWLICANVAFGLFASLYTPTLALYGAELFPTSARAGASSAAWALNRIGSACAPLLLLPLLRSRGPEAMLAVIGATWIVSVLVLGVSPRGQQRRAVG